MPNVSVFSNNFTRIKMQTMQDYYFILIFTFEASRLWQHSQSQRHYIAVRQGVENNKKDNTTIPKWHPGRVHSVNPEKQQTPTTDRTPHFRPPGSIPCVE